MPTVTNAKSTDERGKEYQDWLMRAVLPYGLIIQCYSSRQYQYEHGESANGVEVKFDDNMATTGNVFLEHHEKRNAENPNWVESGFLRKDSDHYLIGNKTEAFLFSTKILRWIYEVCPAEFFSEPDKHIRAGTSRGALMKKAVAEKMCCRHIRF